MRGLSFCKSSIVGLSILFLLFLLVGCSATTQLIPKPTETTVPKDKARIVLERGDNLLGYGATMTILDKDVLIGGLGQNGTLIWDRDPGYLSLTSRYGVRIPGTFGNHSITFEVRSNRVYRVGFDVYGGFVRLNYDQPDGKTDNKADKRTTQGTGWVVGNGVIATNAHVVQDSETITLHTKDGKSHSATLLSIDPINDLALLKSSTSLSPLPLARGKEKIGSEVLTIGYPHAQIMGQNQKLTQGVINATTGMNDDPRMLQISAELQSGNSGGALINTKGEVVGVVTSKLSAAKMLKITGDLPQNVNYAVKISYLLPMLENEGIEYVRGGGGSEKKADALYEGISSSVVMVVAE